MISFISLSPKLSFPFPRLVRSEASYTCNHIHFTPRAVLYFLCQARRRGAAPPRVVCPARSKARPREAIAFTAHVKLYTHSDTTHRNRYTQTRLIIYFAVVIVYTKFFQITSLTTFMIILLGRWLRIAFYPPDSPSMHATILNNFTSTRVMGYLDVAFVKTFTWPSKIPGLMFALQTRSIVSFICIHS